VVTLKVKHGFTRYSFFNELTHGYTYSNVDSLRLTRFKVHEQLSSLCVYIINAQLSQFPANSCQPLIRINKMKTTYLKRLHNAHGRDQFVLNILKNNWTLPKL